MERTPLKDAVDEWLSDEPLSIEELADRAVQAGLVPAGVDDEDFGPLAAIQGLLDRFDDYWTVNSDTAEELVVLASTFVDTGMTFTHRVTGEELENEAIDLMPDLSIVDWMSLEGLSLDDGSGKVVVDYFSGDTSRLTGPPDWIEAVRAGDILAFSRTDGVLSVEVIDEDDLGDGSAEIAALADAAAAWIRSGGGEEEVPVLMEAMACDPSLFRQPVLPVGELLAAIGLERRGHEWGRADEAWQTRQEMLKDDDAAIRRQFGFDRCCDRAFDEVEAAFLDHIRGGEIDAQALAGHLGHGPVAEAFVHVHAVSPRSVTQFATTVADSVTGRIVAPAKTLLGLASLAECDPERAVQALDAAVRADPLYPVASDALARLELDRGNLSRAHTLTVSTSDADPELAEWIRDERERRDALRPSAGRNDPCPCGSGKKFKRCCADGGTLTLDQRAPFIMQRMARYAAGSPGHDTMFGLALSAAGGHDDPVEAIGRFLSEPFLVDVAVHEGGLGEQYTDERGPLLAADELELLEAVLEAPRRLWEITAVSPGETLTLRNTRSGDELTVVEHSGSLGREAGELMLARVAVVDGEAGLFGVPVLVPLRERARVLRMLDEWVDADSLAMWFGSLSLPPRVTNREGEELVARRTVCRIHDEPATVAAALDGAYERQDDNEVWYETVMIDDHESVVRGVLQLDGTLLTLESNSEERQERLLATLDELLDHTILEDGEPEGSDIDEGDRDAPGLVDFNDMPEEIRTLMEQNIVEHEQRWVDESIPALGGLTPRQALDDPTRREDLLALLREFRSHELPEGAIGMSADRVAALLGIDWS